MALSMPDGTSAEISLLPFLDLSQLNCLNETQTHDFKSIVASKTRNTTEAYLSSDADEQVLLNIPFNQAVRVRSIVLRSCDRDQGPKNIKLLINRPSVGFEDVEDASNHDIAQAIELSVEEVAEGKPIPLRFVRFQCVNSLHIFVASNQGATDKTRIDVLDIFGLPVETLKA